MHLLPLYALMVWTGTTSLSTNGTEMLMCFISTLCVWCLRWRSWVWDGLDTFACKVTCWIGCVNIFVNYALQVSSKYIESICVWRLVVFRLECKEQTVIFTEQTDDQDISFMLLLCWNYPSSSSDCTSVIHGKQDLHSWICGPCVTLDKHTCENKQCLLRLEITNIS